MVNLFLNVYQARACASRSASEVLHVLPRETEEVAMRCEEKSDHIQFMQLTERILSAIKESF